MRPNELIRLLQRFVEWTKEHEDLVVASKDIGYGDKELFTLERGYRITSVASGHDPFGDFTTITLSVRKLGGDHIPNVEFWYYPTGNKLTFTSKDGVESEWTI